VVVDRFLHLLGPVNSQSYAAVEKAYVALRQQYLEVDPDYRRDDIRLLDAGMDAFRAAWTAKRHTTPYRASEFVVSITAGRTYRVGEAPGGVLVGFYPPDLGPVYIVTPFARSPSGSEYDLGELEELVDHVTGLELECCPAELRPKSGRAIPAVGLVRAERATVVELARDFGNQVVICWDPEGWHSLAPGSGPIESAGWTCEQVSEAVVNRVTQRKRRRRAAAAKREARERQELERSQRLSEGWPASWDLRQMREWQRAGGTGETAQALTTAGWRPAEVLAVLQSPGVDPAAISVPAVSASLQRPYGVSLVDLVTGSLPPVPEGAVFSIRCSEPDGRWVRVVVMRVGDALSAQRHEGSGDGSWISSPVEDVPCSLTDYIQSSPLLHEIGAGAIKEYVTNEDVLATADLLKLLTPMTVGGAENPSTWGLGVSSDWTDEDRDLPELEDGLNWVHRWARINGTRVTAIDVGADGASTLVVVLCDPGEETFVVPVKELAENSWWSESGGAPITWDGGNSLSDLGGGLVMDRRWGDLDTWSKIVNVGQDAMAQAEYIAEWIDRCDCTVPAALNFEPFDPDDVLSPRQREWWIERMSDSAYTMWLDAGDEVDQAVTTILGERYSLYSRTREAMAHPHSDDARKLAYELSQVRSYGAQGTLLTGDWGDGIEGTDYPLTSS
jgi:hypothetical protein